jgi:hypothetical protein
MSASTGDLWHTGECPPPSNLSNTDHRPAVIPSGAIGPSTPARGALILVFWVVSGQKYPPSAARRGRNAASFGRLGSAAPAIVVGGVGVASIVTGAIVLSSGKPEQKKSSLRLAPMHHGIALAYVF